MTTHAIGVSGGKDSTALALALTDIYPNRDWHYICTPTGDELPEMLAHWDYLECLLGKPLTRITHKLDLKELCEQENMLPNFRARFCTRELKIKPCQEWINERSKEGEVVLYVGLRADEEGREGGRYDNCKVEFPFRDWGWSIDEVMGYLKARKINIPLRTDCARCFWQTLPEWWMLWKNHPGIYQDAVDQETQFGHTFRSPKRDTWPASLKEMRAQFEGGKLPRGLKKIQEDVGFYANKCRVCSL